MDARQTVRLGKVFTFFGVMLLALGLVQVDAGALGNGFGKNFAPGQAKKAPTVVEDNAAVDEASSDGCGSYCSTSDGTPSGNGNGDGGNQPCAGCVGGADNHNPPGQFKDGQDPNNGYECDGNNGVAEGNPAHSGCRAPTTTAAPPTTTTTAPPTTTTTTAPATTTTVTGETTTTIEDAVLGAQFNRGGGEQARGFAATGVSFYRPMTMLGALLLLLGVALMTIRVRPETHA